MLKKSQTKPNAINTAGSVIRMQTNIIAFRRNAQKSDMFSLSPEERGNNERKTTNYQGQLEGYKPVGKFMVDHFMNNKEYGNQYLPVDMGSPQRNTMGVGASKLDSLPAIVDSIGRVGSPGSPGSGTSEFKADGIWGPRTNNALKLICNVVTTMYLFSKSVRFEITTINDGLLSEFKSFIPEVSPYESKESVLEQQTKANIINSKFLEPALKFLEEFNANIESKKDIKETISQSKPFLTLTKSTEKLGDSDDLSENEHYEKGAAGYKPNYGVKIMLDQKPLELSYTDLSNYENLKKAVQRVSPAWASNQQYMNQVVKKIEEATGAQ